MPNDELKQIAYALESLAARLHNYNDDPESSDDRGIADLFAAIAKIQTLATSLTPLLGNVGQLQTMIGGINDLVAMIATVKPLFAQLSPLIVQLTSIVDALQNIGGTTPDQPITSPPTSPGSKRALCIGINYKGTTAALRGCLNDARGWMESLNERGVSPVMLTETLATHHNIVTTIERECEQCGPNDLLVIQYSGHGTWQADQNGDEEDRRDEAWVPYDYQQSGLILDDDLGAILAMARGTVVVISDSCHSGTMSRAVDRVDDDWRNRFLPPMMDEHDAAVAAQRFRPQHTSERAAIGDNVILLSGCQDSETSADAQINGRWCGAFSHFALSTLQLAESDWTYLDWMTAIRRVLPSREYRQTPGITATDAMSRKRIFS